MTSIFSTPEAEAWCRGFGHEDYLILCERIAHKAVAQRTYEILCEAFEAQYEEDCLQAGCVDSFEDVCVEDLG